jgi:hypothetical protein
VPLKQGPHAYGSPPHRPRGQDHPTNHQLTIPPPTHPHNQPTNQPTTTAQPPNRSCPPYLRRAPRLMPLGAVRVRQLSGQLARVDVQRGQELVHLQAGRVCMGVCVRLTRVCPKSVSVTAVRLHASLRLCCGWVPFTAQSARCHPGLPDCLRSARPDLRRGGGPGWWSGRGCGPVWGGGMSQGPGEGRIDRMMGSAHGGKAVINSLSDTFSVIQYYWPGMVARRSWREGGPVAGGGKGGRGLSRPKRSSGGRPGYTEVTPSGAPHRLETRRTRHAPHTPHATRRTRHARRSPAPCPARPWAFGPCKCGRTSKGFKYRLVRVIVRHITLSVTLSCAASSGGTSPAIDPPPGASGARRKRCAWGSGGRERGMW